MTRLSMSELTTFRWSFEEDLLHCREAGYQAVGVWLRKLRDFGEFAAIDLIEESGLGVSSVAWEGGFTGGDARSAAENIAAARDTLTLCGEIDARCLVVHSGGRNGHTRRHAGRLLSSAIEALLPSAEAAGVPLAIEPMHPNCADEWTLFTSLRSALDFVQSYDSPWLRLAYDTYHFPLAEPEWPLLAEAAPWLAVVHVGDVCGPHDADQSRAPLGDGEAPLVGLTRTLLEGGYRGDLEVKLIGPAVEGFDYHALLQDSRRVMRAITSSASLAPLAAD